MKIIRLGLLLMMFFSLVACAEYDTDSLRHSSVKYVATDEAFSEYIEETHETTDPTTDPRESAIEPGLYVLSSVGNDGDVTFFTDIDPERGSVRIEADHCGIWYMKGEEILFQYNDSYFLLEDGTELPYRYFGSEMTEGSPLLAFYFENEQGGVVSWALYLVEEG